MSLFRLEDLLAPRAEAMQALDLSTARPRTKQEFEKLLVHIPEFRIKPEKVFLKFFLIQYLLIY